MSMRPPDTPDRQAYRRRFRLSRLAGFALLAALAATTGCGRDPALAGIDALAREAARAAGRPPPPEATRPVPYPGVQARRVTEPESRIGVMDFFALKRCRVRGLVAERNSVLGRLQDSARRVAYEHAVLTGLEACLAELSDSVEDAELAGVVSRVVGELRERLPAVRWNAGFGSDELAASFAPGAGALPAQLDVVRNQAAAVVRLAGALEAIGTAAGPIDRDALVAAQEILEKGRYGARLHRALAAATDGMQSVAASLETLAAAGCPKTVQPLQRQAGQLEAWLDALEAQGSLWFEALARLIEVSPPPPASFTEWMSAEADREAPEGRWQRFLGARQRLDAALGLCPAGGAQTNRKD